MADAAEFYPPAPANVPKDLTTPTPDYRRRVVLVLTTLFLFVALYLGLVIGSAYLCCHCFATANADPPTPASSAFRDLLRDLDREEKRVLATYNRTVEQRKLGEIDDNRSIQIIERDVLPPWQAMRQRLTQTTGLTAEEQHIAQQLGRYIQLTEESWALVCRAVREHNQLLANSANEQGREAQKLAKDVGTSITNYAKRVAQPRDRGGNVWLVIIGIASGVLCLFLVKGLFKRRLVDRGPRLEISEKEQPQLFAFIRRVCRDTAAPTPHRVYLTPDVNASVFYHESLLSLFLPTPKNLVIGLGLVNRLNLSEFKAVLAHEFGHFSQRSMKLGNYVYRCNKILVDLVFGRDWLDEVMRVLGGLDLRIAIFVWTFMGVLWGVRKTLQGVFRIMNFANTALSRQMEFNADLVAVSVAGSDALIHGLARLDFATDSLAQAWSDLAVAADHKLYSRDLFFHQTRAAEYLRGVRKNASLGEPPTLPGDPTQTVQVFSPEDTTVPKMWATHPCNHDREVNAKRRYIRSPIDDRTPWVLFENAEAMREEITRRIYRMNKRFEHARLMDPEIVQNFIDEEHAETTYHARYHGLYDHRFVNLGGIDELVGSSPAQFADRAALAEAHAQLYGDELKTRMEGHYSRQEDYGRLAPLAGGAVELTGKDFQFRGSRYRAADAARLLQQVKKELEEDFAWMGSRDRQVFLVYHTMAKQFGEEIRQELEARYRFEAALTEILKELSAAEAHVHGSLNLVAGKSQLTQAEFSGTLATLQFAHNALAKNLEAASKLALPTLKNVTPGAPLAPFLLGEPLVRPLTGQEKSLDGKWIGRFLEQLGDVLGKARRIHFKSLGGILALQERIAERWAESGQQSPGVPTLPTFQAVS